MAALAVAAVLRSVERVTYVAITRWPVWFAVLTIWGVFLLMRFPDDDWRASPTSRRGRLGPRERRHAPAPAQGAVMASLRIA